MEDTKLFYVLDQMDIYSLNRLEKFIQSPYFNMNERIMKFFDILNSFIRKKRKNQAIELPDNENIWFEITDEKAFNKIRFRKMTSDFLKLVERFLAQEEYQGNPIHKAKNLLAAVHNLKLEKLNKNSIKTARRYAQQQMHKPASYYYHQYEIEKSFYELTDFEKNRMQKSNKHNINLEEIAKNLDHFYLAEKMRYYCTFLMWQRIYSHEFNLLFIDEIIKQVENIAYKDIPPIAIYYQIYLTLKDPEKIEHYHHLKELIDLHIKQFPDNEAKNIHDSATNYCIDKINKGNFDFLQELFKIYKSSVENNLILVRGVLTQWTYKNIATCAIRAGEYQWVEKFMSDYKSKLADDEQENAFTYNMGLLHFHQKDFSSALEYLHNVDYKEWLYSLNSKKMLLVIYYELDEYEVLASFLDSLTISLKRDKNFPADRRKSRLNLIRLTRKLINLAPKNKTAIAQTEKEIHNAKQLESRNWLIEKIEELK